MHWLWYFWIYSFLGFLLEIAFARVIRHPKRDRKCLYFLPMCPVYGLGAVLILLLPEAVRARPLLLFPCAVLAATAAEYAMGFFYERVARVRFWDYGGMPLQVQGRICLPFSLAWGVLAVALIYAVHPAVEALGRSIPDWLTVALAAFFALDAGLSVYLLRREGSTEALRWYLRFTAGVRESGN